MVCLGSRFPDDDELSPFLPLSSPTSAGWVAVGDVISVTDYRSSVLKFKRASAIAVGALTGVMFLVFAAEEFLLAVLGQERRQVVVVDLRSAANRLRNHRPDPARKDLRRVRRHPRLGVPDDRASLDGSGVHRAAFARRVVARPDQRQPAGLTGLLGERPVLPHAHGHIARLRWRLGAGEGHHRHRAGMPAPSARLKLTEPSDLAVPRRDSRRVSTAEVRR